MSGYYCGECGNGFREAEGYHRTSCSKKTEAETLRAENTRLLSTLESCRAELAEAKEARNQCCGICDAAEGRRVFDKWEAAEAALAEARTHKEVWSNQFKKVCDDRDEARRELADSLAREKLTEGERDEARADLAQMAQNCEKANTELFEARAIAVECKSELARVRLKGENKLAEALAANAENARLATLNGQEVVRLTAEVERLKSKAASVGITDHDQCADAAENAALTERVTERERLIAELNEKMRSSLYEQQEEWTKDFRAKCDENAALLAKIETLTKIIEHTEFVVRGGDKDLALKILRGEVLMTAPSTPTKEK